MSVEFLKLFIRNVTFNVDVTVVNGNDGELMKGARVGAYQVLPDGELKWQAEGTTDDETKRGKSLKSKKTRRYYDTC